MRKILLPFLALLAFGSTAVRAQEDGPSIGKAEYQARRQKLREQLKDGVIVLLGTKNEEYGEFVKFRQRNDLMYLVGADQPDATLVIIPEGIAADGKPREILFLPARNPGQERWMGKRIGPGDEGREFYGIDQVVANDRVLPTLIELLTASKRLPILYTVQPASAEGPQATREGRFVDTLKRVLPSLQVKSLSGPVGEFRKLKSPAEIALLQRAIDITGESQRDAATTIRPGAYEYSVQAAVEAAFTRNGAERPGFFSIIGSGPNSTVLHYNENRRKIASGDLVVVDIGAEYRYYTADVTRTYPANGKFTSRQREVYQLVLDAQKSAADAFVPGMTTIAQLGDVARKTMLASPLRDGEGQTLDRYFLHGLSHWLGMDVHDVGSYGGPIPAGAVFTIEPGIYISQEDFGIRIEDDYLATENGLVKLSGKIPSDPDAVEAAMTTGNARASHP